MIKIKYVIMASLVIIINTSCSEKHEEIKLVDKTKEYVDEEEDIEAKEEVIVEEEGEKTFTSVGGYLLNYDATNLCGCIHVDKEMVSAGVAKSLGNKVDEYCVSKKYGNGALIEFSQVQKDADYANPKENLLMLYTGYWQEKKGKTTFHVTEIEPFF